MASQANPVGGAVLEQQAGKEAHVHRSSAVSQLQFEIKTVCVLEQAFGIFSEEDQDQFFIDETAVQPSVKYDSLLFN